MTIQALTLIDLHSVSGGQSGSFADYTNTQRTKTADAYRQVVCTTAGIQGAGQLASGMYGTGASDTDKIRAAEVLKSYCAAGASLPAQAPKAPF